MWKLHKEKRIANDEFVNWIEEIVCMMHFSFVKKIIYCDNFNWMENVLKFLNTIGMRENDRFSVKLYNNHSFIIFSFKITFIVTPIPLVNISKLCLVSRNSERLYSHGQNWPECLMLADTFNYLFTLAHKSIVLWFRTLFFNRKCEYLFCIEFLSRQSNFKNKNDKRKRNKYFQNYYRYHDSCNSIKQIQYHYKWIISLAIGMNSLGSISNDPSRCLNFSLETSQKIDYSCVALIPHDMVVFKKWESYSI